MPKIYSTLSNSNTYPVYAAKKEGDKTGVNAIKKAIVIYGGANVRDRVTMQTPAYKVTEVTADDLKLLKENKAFMRKLNAGFYTIDKEPTVSKKDKSAQLTESDVMKINPNAKSTTQKVDEE